MGRVPLRMLGQCLDHVGEVSLGMRRLHNMGRYNKCSSPDYYC
jgi:hypothetical protein